MIIQGTKIMRVVWITTFILLCSTQAAFAETFEVDFTPTNYLSQYAGNIPYSAYDYAKTPGRGNVDRTVMVNPDYSFRVVLDYDGDGVNDLASRTTYVAGETEPYSWKGRDYTAFNLGRNSVTKPKIRYSNLILYKKQWIDVETTVVAWGTDNDNKAYFSGGFVETNLFHVNWIRLEHRFYLAGTNTPVEINGFLTYEDVDLKQGIALRKNEVDKIWCNTRIVNGGQGTRLKYLETNTLLKIRDTVGENVVADPQTEEEKKLASMAVFSYTFSGSSHTQYFSDGRGLAEKWSLFGFSAAKVIPSDLPDEEMTTKTLVDGDEQEVTENAIHKASETWTYHVNAPVPMETETVNYIDGLSMRDEIDGCLEVKNVKVIRGTDENVTNQFNITIRPPQGSDDSTRVLATAKNTRSAEFHGYTYSLKITVGIKAGRMRLTDHGHYDETRGRYVFHNTGKVVYLVDSENNERQTNEVTTILHVPWSASNTPGLKITKQSSKNSWFAGNQVDYTITVKHVNPEATAENVLIEDYTLPDYLQLQANTLSLTGCEGSVTKAGNGFKAEIGELEYGRTATITFKAKALDGSEKKTIPNTATAAADLVPEESASTQVKILENESTVYITKEIRIEDLYSYHGTPVFVFCLSGTTADGMGKEYYRVAEFPIPGDDAQLGPDDVYNEENGIYSKTVMFENIKPGSYSCKEIEVDRFQLEEITDVSDNGSIRGDFVRFQLVDAEEGRATFVNRKTNWNGYSDSKCIVNRFGKVPK